MSRWHTICIYTLTWNKVLSLKQAGSLAKRLKTHQEKHIILCFLFMVKERGSYTMCMSNSEPSWDVDGGKVDLHYLWFPNPMNRQFSLQEDWTSIPHQGTRLVKGELCRNIYQTKTMTITHMKKMRHGCVVRSADTRKISLCWSNATPEKLVSSLGLCRSDWASLSLYLLSNKTGNWASFTYIKRGCLADLKWGLTLVLSSHIWFPLVIMINKKNKISTI